MSEEHKPADTPKDDHNVGELIAESKKYRQRAQQAEEKMAAFESEIAELKEAQAKAEREKKEKEMSAEERAAELAKDRDALAEKLTSVQSQMKAYEDQQRERLLSVLPDDRKEKVKDWPLQQLDVYVNDFNELQGAGIPGGKPAGSPKGGEFGGYSSWTEFMTRDPENARKALAEENRKEINWAYGVE